MAACTPGSLGQPGCLIGTPVPVASIQCSAIVSAGFDTRITTPGNAVQAPIRCDRTLGWRVLITELMAPLLGDWQGAEQQEASPWAPALGARAALRFKYDAGGSVVVEDYRQVRDDGIRVLRARRLPRPGRRGLVVVLRLLRRAPGPSRRRLGGRELALAKTTVRGTAVHRFRSTWDQLDYRITLGAAAEGEVTPFLAGTYSRISGH